MEFIEIIGIAAFAIAGAMVAIDKGADLFGVIFLSLVASLGGGVIRDLLLGNTPPVMFTSYKFVSVVLVCALGIFIIAYSNIERYAKLYPVIHKLFSLLKTQNIPSHFRNRYRVLSCRGCPYRVGILRFPPTRREGYTEFF